MGQKVNPKVIRIGLTRDWDSKWYASKKDYTRLLHEDLEIDKLIKSKLKEGGVSKIEILRTQGKVIVNIHTSRPGVIIGRGGSIIEDLKTLLQKKFDTVFAINIKEIKKPALDAATLGESVGHQVEKRISYRRAAKMGIEKALEAGALGAKIRLSGRLNGVEIAREEFFSQGKIPLHTFRADIDYATHTAQTRYGAIGIKVWIYKGEIFKNDLKATLQNQIEEIKQS
jgi:small subunit ribosomal protein S3